MGVREPETRYGVCVTLPLGLRAASMAASDAPSAVMRTSAKHDQEEELFNQSIKWRSCQAGTIHGLLDRRGRVAGLSIQVLRVAGNETLKAVCTA